MQTELVGPLLSGAGLTPIAQLVENFPNLDSAKWTTTANTGSGSVVVSGGELRLQHDWSNTFAGWPPTSTKAVSVKSYKLATSGVYFRFKPIVVNDGGAGYAHTVTTLIGCVINDTDSLKGPMFRHRSEWNGGALPNGRLYCLVSNNHQDEWWHEVGEIASYAPDGAHAFLRIRESENTYYWDTAPDNGSGSPGTWTNRFSYSITGANVSDGQATPQSVKFIARTYHWDNNFDASYVVDPPRVDAINGSIVTTVNTNSVADPATYATTGAAATSTKQVFSNALPAAYAYSAPVAASGQNTVSIALPGAFTLSGGPASASSGLSSVALPAAYTLSASPAFGGYAFVSVALPATYSHTGAPAEHRRGYASIATPAAYSMVGVGTLDLKALLSAALPATYTHTGGVNTRALHGRTTQGTAAVYGMTGAPATSVVQRNYVSAAMPAAYSLVPADTRVLQALRSIAVPGSFVMVPSTGTESETTGELEVKVYDRPPPVPIFTEAQFQAWVHDPTALRVVLVEAQGIDVNGNITQLFLGSKGFVTKREDGANARHYLPFMMGGLDFEQRLDLDLSGEHSYGDIELDNTEGDLDWMFDHVWLYQPVRAYIGDARWPRRDFRQIFDGSIEDIDASDRDSVHLRVRDKLHRLEMPLHEDKIRSGPNADRLQPVVFGECHNITPLLVDPTQLRYVYHRNEAESVFEVRDNGVPIQRSTNPGPPATFSLSKQPFGRITCSVQGDAGQNWLPHGPNGADDTGYSDKVVPIINKLLKWWGTEMEKRFTDFDIDLENFEQFNLNNQQSVGLFVSERMTVLEACQQIAASVGARMTMTALGKVQLVKLNVPPIGSPIDVGQSDMLGGTLRIEQRLPLVPSVKLGYCRNWTVQEDTASGLPEEHKAMFAREWYTTSATNPETRDRYTLWAEAEQENCLLLTDDDAAAECGRRLWLRSFQRHIYSFTGFSDLMFTPIGSAMRITHPRFGLHQGKVGQVVAVAVNWLNCTVSIKVVI